MPELYSEGFSRRPLAPQMQALTPSGTPACHAKVQSHFIESMRTIGSLKRFDAEDRRSNDWLNKLVMSINCQVKTNRIHLIYDLSRYVVSAMTLLVVVYLGAAEIVATTLSLGMLYAMVAYTNHLTNAVLSLTREWQNFLMLSLHIQRISDILEAPADTRTTPIGHTEVNEILFDDVSFIYPGQSQPVINHLDLCINADDKIAIFGPSGCGKSTLLQLLMGHEQPTSGEITIDKRRASNLVRTSTLFSSIMQSDQLISGTLRENISFLHQVPDEKRLRHCAELACIHDEVMRLPLAYNQKVGELGSELSAGQQQRILIARALYRDAPVLLLDEGTCHLDLQTELHVIRNILAQPGICLFVTHRPEIAQLAHRTVDEAG